MASIRTHFRVYDGDADRASVGERVQLLHGCVGVSVDVSLADRGGYDCDGRHHACVNVRVPSPHVCACDGVGRGEESLTTRQSGHTLRFGTNLSIRQELGPRALHRRTERLQRTFARV